MNAPFRFLHASDFHLDRPPRGLAEVPDQLRPVLVDAPYRAAERVFDAALKEHVDFVLLSGDLVEPALAGPRGLVFLSQQFRRLSVQGVGVYWALARGDRFDRWGEALPHVDGLVRFARDRVERVVHRRGEAPIAQILGTSSEQRKRIRLSDFQPDGDMFSIGVAHGSADAELLARHSVNFWALGGEHERRSVLAGPSVAQYSGSPQGRRPRESGPHGCTLVQVDETARTRTSFIPTDAVRYLDERVTVNESTTGEQLYQVLSERVGELAGDPFGPDLLVEWTIVGSKSLGGELRRGKLAIDLLARLRSDHAQRRPSLWTVSIDAETAADVPAEQYEEDTLLGEFLRTVRHYAEHPEDPLDLEPYFSARHAAGSLAGAVALDDPAVHKRVLAEVARLGVALLSPQEPRR